MFLLGVLLTCRFWMPPEASVFGETLWLAAATCLAAGGLWAVSRGHFDVRSPLDMSVAFIVAGQIVSTLTVFLTTGDRRSSFNLTMEWIAIGSVWPWFRHWFSGPRWDYLTAVSDHSNGHARPAHVRGVSLSPRGTTLYTAAMVAALTGWALLQAGVQLPASARQYGDMLSEMNRLESRIETDVRVQERYAGLQQKLAEAGVPTDTAGRAAFFQRLTSHEPFGPFALANTLGGLLATGMIVLAGLAMMPQSKASRGAVLGLIALAGIALVLTKSRTAWVGFFLGLLLLGGNFWRGALQRTVSLQAGSTVDAAEGVKPRSSRPMWIVGGIVLGLVLVLGLGYAMGGLDKQVLTEAPKSLKYRLEYWTSSLRLLTSSPEKMLLGVGPGNFRGEYLRFKWPESSEDIADPHQMLLDAWSSGGLLSLAGVLLLLGCMWVTLLRRRATDVPQDLSPVSYAAETASYNPASRVASVGVASLLMVFVVRFSLENLLDDNLIYAGIVWVLVIMAAVMIQVPLTVPRLVALIAAITMSVHLQGAGGFGMPTPMLAFLALVAAGSTRVVWIRRKISDNTVEGLKPADLPTSACVENRLVRGSLVLLHLGLALLIVGGGILPIRAAADARSAASREAGEYLATLGRTGSSSPNREATVVQAYRKAVDADPWSPSIPEQAAMELGELWRRALRSHAEPDSFMTAAISLLDEAHREQPASYAPLWQKGSLLREFAGQKAARNPRADVAGERREAIAALEAARDRYPFNARVLLELALALEDAGRKDDAARAASDALAQHDLNARLGHMDKLLPDARVAVLKRLVTP